MVECQLPKLEVAGSSPVIRSKTPRIARGVLVSATSLCLILFLYGLRKLLALDICTFVHYLTEHKRN